MPKFKVTGRLILEVVSVVEASDYEDAMITAEDTGVLLAQFDKAEIDELALEITGAEEI